MFHEDFFKKIYELKLQYSNQLVNNPLQLQSILRKNIDNNRIALWVFEVIMNEKKFENKFPKLINSGGLLKGVVCEQATDEQVAEHKASFFKGYSFLDLTAGLAIDTMAFAKKFSNVIAVETNPDLIGLLQFNSNQLGFQNIKFVKDIAENFLSYNTSLFDLVYLDPSRKVQQKKVYHPKDCSPNIFEILPSLNQISNQILIKLSPMIEIQELLKWFQNIEWIWVISKDYECKEILVILNFEYDNTPKYRLSILQKNNVFVYELQSNSTYELYSDLSFDDYQWILIPDVTFVKTHTLIYLQNQTQGFLTSKHDGILFLPQKPKNYYGKLKKVIKIMTIKEFEIYQKKLNLFKAQVLKRHFPLKVEEIRKKWKILEGNLDTLIFFKQENQSYVVHCVEEPKY